MNLPKYILYKITLLFMCSLTIMLFTKLLPFPKTPFQSEFAFRYLTILQSNGARVPYSQSHTMARQYIMNVLKTNGWSPQIQTGTEMGHSLNNIFAVKGPDRPSVILGSHYDSRMIADNDLLPAFQALPVPGANDGGSSSAVLLELSRVLPQNIAAKTMLVFFDLEDQGNINEWDWILGSRYFAVNLDFVPKSMVLLDMVGEYDQQIVPPANSDSIIYEEIRKRAFEHGYSEYYSQPSSGGIIDDHVPFLEIEIPAVDLIDIHDPRWHTTEDDLENVYSESLQRIGDTIYSWLTLSND